MSEKKVERVTKGRVIRKRKKTQSKMMESLSIVFSAILSDVAIPAAKDLISDAVSEGVDRLLFGESVGRRSGRSTNQKSGYVSYNRYSSNSRQHSDPREKKVNKAPRSRHGFDDVILSSRQEADEVLDQLYTMLDQYESVTVADFYSLIGLETKYTDDDWGWTELKGSGVRKTREGFVIELPEPIFLD